MRKGSLLRPPKLIIILWTYWYGSYLEKCWIWLFLKWFTGMSYRLYIFNYKEWKINSLDEFKSKIKKLSVYNVVNFFHLLFIISSYSFYSHNIFVAGDCYDKSINEIERFTHGRLIFSPLNTESILLTDLFPDFVFHFAFG